MHAIATLVVSILLSSLNICGFILMGWTIVSEFSTTFSSRY